MKIFKCKDLSFELKKGEKASYKDLIIACLDSVPNNGFTREELKQRDRIEDTINANSEIKLEDADMENLKRIVNEMRWGIRHKEIVEFIEEINKL